MQEFGVRVEDGRLYLCGDVDMIATPDLHRALEQAARTDGAGLTIDLEQVTFLDSSGLRELTIALRYGKEIVLRGVTPSIRSVLEVTGLDAVFKIHDDVT